MLDAKKIASIHKGERSDKSELKEMPMNMEKFSHRYIDQHSSFQCRNHTRALKGSHIRSKRRAYDWF